MWNVYSDRGIDKTLEFTCNLNNDKSQQLKVLKKPLQQNDPTKPNPGFLASFKLLIVLTLA